MDSPKSSQHSKSYFSEDDDSVEELLLYLMNEVCKVFSLTQLKSVEEICNLTTLQSLLIKLDPQFDSVYNGMDMTKASVPLSFEDSYSNLSILMNGIEEYFNKIKTKGQFKLLPGINWKDMVNINNLISGSRTETQILIKIMLTIVSTSENRDSYLDKLSEGKEKYLDGFLDIVQKYIDLTEDQQTETLEQFKRRFTTRTSVLFSSKDPSIVFNCIDKLRKNIDDLQHEKEGLMKAVTKAEAEKKEFSRQIDIFQSTISMYQIREEEFKGELNDMKRSHQFIPTDQSILKNEILLVEKTQELKQLEETSTLKISQLNHEITQLKNENLDLVMINEQSLQLHHDNTRLKEEILQLKKEIYDLNITNDNEKKQFNQEISKHRDRIIELEKENNNYQSRVVILKNDILAENEKNDIQNNTIVLLETKYKELEHKFNVYQSMNNSMPIINYNDIQLKELIERNESKDKMINELQKEIDILKRENEEEKNKTKIEYEEKIVTKTVSEVVTKIVKQFDGLQRVRNEQREIIHTSSIASKEKLSKEIMRSREEVKKRDRDIEFLKKAYTELKTKSEEEYNMVSSSLYELALHLTKIKSEINCNNTSKNILNGNHEPIKPFIN